MILLIEPGVTTGFNRLVIFTGPGPSDRLDDYEFRVLETCCTVAVIADTFDLRRLHGIEAQIRVNSIPL